MAQFNALNKSFSNKRERTNKIVAMVSISTKRQYMSDLNRPRLWCMNPHYMRKLGHETANCIVYTGAKQGQYPDW
jgi:hypothetical protein